MSKYDNKGTELTKEESRAAVHKLNLSLEKVLDRVDASDNQDAKLLVKLLFTYAQKYGESYNLSLNNKDYDAFIALLQRKVDTHNE